jgi:AcrR family transcriptional regulator
MARLPANERREQLLDQAAEAILEGGRAALTMEGLARRAGVSKGLGYAYFANADELARALYLREVSRVYERVEAAMRGPERFELRLERATAAYFDVIAERGTLFTHLQAALETRAPDRAFRRRVGEFVEFWAREMAASYALPMARARAAAAGALSFSDTTARLWANGRIGRAEAIELCVRFISGGLRAAVS